MSGIASPLDSRGDSATSRVKTASAEGPSRSGNPQEDRTCVKVVDPCAGVIVSSAAMSAPDATPAPDHGDAPKITSRRDLARLALGALGVVYGDIGTSPLYAIRECFNPVHGIESNLANTLGILSLVFWSLTLVVVVKYLTFVMRADNHGDGGILALLALVMPKSNGGRATTRAARPDPAGAGRRGPALGRRHDHARHHGARGDRGPRGRHAGLPAVRGPDRARHPRRTLRRPEARHGADRRDVRPGHAGVVRGDRRARVSPGSCASRGCSRR